MVSAPVGYKACSGPIVDATYDYWERERGPDSDKHTDMIPNTMIRSPTNHCRYSLLHPNSYC